MSARHRQLKKHIREAEAEVKRIDDLESAYQHVYNDTDLNIGKRFQDKLLERVYRLASEREHAMIALASLRLKLVAESVKR